MHLKCRECEKQYEIVHKYICDECFGPLDVIYDKTVKKSSFESRRNNFWRYFEMLPILDKKNIVDIGSTVTPLVKAENLGSRLGLKNLYIKNDSVNPTGSFKDRPAGVAVSKAVEFGLKSVGCASTGNLASATAAHAAKAKLNCYVFAPNNLETAKKTQALIYGANYKDIDGTYDNANTIATSMGEKENIGMVNINLRNYYVEGSKTFSYEVSEQLGWNTPDHIVVPVGSGAMLNAICKGFEELEELSILNIDNLHVNAAQPRGCAPVYDAVMTNNQILPVEKPSTIATSLAIGDPGDGRYVIDRLKQYNGIISDATDAEIIDAIRLLAKTEGIFTEPAGGTALVGLEKMVNDGKIDKTQTVIVYITGNGLKTIEAFS